MVDGLSREDVDILIDVVNRKRSESLLMVYDTPDGNSYDYWYSVYKKYDELLLKVIGCVKSEK